MFISTLHVGFTLFNYIIYRTFLDLYCYFNITKNNMILNYETAMDIPDKEGQKRLVIVGGGFGGLKLARKLKSNKFQIVLLDKNNHHIFQPLLYQVATAGIEPSAISFPYRKIFKKESISIYVFVKHSKSSRNTICWRLPSARWHTTIWSLPPAATQIILETTGWRNRPWH